ncbi:citrate synthase-like protein [Syncephalis plumigaleata]|nr:citrate synthase-like protein [Syncephalis plumigaleata]
MVASPIPGLSGDESDQGLRVYDPAFQNTAVARSKITYIDGDNGILRYRGYPIEELAERSNFLEVTYLLIYGELPTKEQFDQFSHQRSSSHVNISSRGQSCIEWIRHVYNNERVRNKQILRLLGKVPTLAAVSYRHRIGRPYNLPRNDLSYTENFLYMMDRLSEEKYRPNPKLARALDILFILHADHELNCSTAAMRHIGSSRVDPYSAIAGASAALYGPLHGGANELYIHTTLGGITYARRDGTVDAVPQFLEQVKQRKKKLMGFGHRVYKNYDPRAKIIRQVAYEGLIDVAVELERAALSDDYFVKRRLYPNVDFYSVLFTSHSSCCWLAAHWVEACKDPDTKIWRPRQVYDGEPKRSYVPFEHRTDTPGANDATASTERNPLSKRSAVASFEEGSSSSSSSTKLPAKI